MVLPRQPEMNTRSNHRHRAPTRSAEDAKLALTEVDYNGFGDRVGIQDVSSELSAEAALLVSSQCHSHPKVIVAVHPDCSRFKPGRRRGLAALDLGLGV